ncbi:MAG: hypothetical protein ACFE91_06770 [Promethearchaeota archaeon]
MKIVSSLLVSDMCILFNAPNAVKMMIYGIIGVALMDLVIYKKVKKFL